MPMGFSIVTSQNTINAKIWVDNFQLFETPDY
jgi:hypothetical protein